jgi:choline dehydrogenase
MLDVPIHHANMVETANVPPVGVGETGGDDMTTRQDVSERIEADFVVVGAGSAGCAVAARLSEDPRTRVVLIEAGGEDKNRWIHIPLGFGKTFADPSVNWCYETEPDPGAADRRVFWPRGKVLGGSSSINGMVYIRGQAEDFDHWRQLGNAGWSFEDVLPYFKRAEHQVRGADGFHGTGGPLCVSDVAQHPICEAFIAATTELGFPRNDDFNGASQDGAGYHQTTTRNGRRCSTAVGYLRPAMQRPSLRVVTSAMTEKVLFEGRRATGVAFRQDGRLCTARAASEVILCGGAVNSPQLLMLSGIGAQPHLAEFGVAVVQHLPGVGQSLQDHYSAAIKLKCRLPVTVNDVMLSNARKLKAGLQYYMFHRGPLSMISSPGALFARTRPELASPDIKISISPFSAERPQDGLHRFSGFTSIAYQLRPESRGEIKLKSPDPFDAPAVHANYLSAETDQRTIVAGLKLIRRILANPHMQPFVEAEFQPGPEVESDEQLLDYARRRGGTVYHPTSTCKMGGDPMAVVDPELRVHGIDGLRVADASIMPTVVSGNTNAATIMIGEKLADIVRQRVKLAA